MRWAIFSDVHANLPALEALVHASTNNADAYLCLGDVVNYGPWNDECLALVLSLPGIVLLEGNHERLFLGSERIGDQLPLVQAFTRASGERFHCRDWIVGLPEQYEVGDYLCSHTLSGQRIYANTPIEISRNHIIGHTHHPFRVTRGSHTLVNCGSVGQNRKHLGQADYVIYDTETKEVVFCSQEYPVAVLIAEMRARRYPEDCIHYYLKNRA